MWFTLILIYTFIEIKLSVAEALNYTRVNNKKLIITYLSLFNQFVLLFVLIIVFIHEQIDVSINKKTNK